VHAYVETREKTDELISAGTVKEFGIAVFDLNGLKHVNDTQGHEAGDKYIISGCKLIREYFPNCSVYRIGGDEFVIILEGEAYQKRDEMLAAFNDRMDSNGAQGLVTISAGLDVFRPEEDNDMNTVFVRADRKMYKRKKEMKAAA
jgi:diguanylate cyclase (GGDEF)-like protein